MSLFQSRGTKRTAFDGMFSRPFGDQLDALLLQVEGVDPEDSVALQVGAHDGKPG